MNLLANLFENPTKLQSFTVFSSPQSLLPQGLCRNQQLKSPPSRADMFSAVLARKLLSCVITMSESCTGLQLEVISTARILIDIVFGRNFQSKFIPRIEVLMNARK